MSDRVGRSRSIYLLICLVAAILTGCADSAAERARISSSIARLQSGAVVREVELAMGSAVALTTDAKEPLTSLSRAQAAFHDFKRMKSGVFRRDFTDQDLEELGRLSVAVASQCQNAPQSKSAWLNYYGDPDALRARFPLYRKQRDLDNPQLDSVFAQGKRNAEHSRPGRVAFLDSGIDFVKFPELGLFLGDSYDFSDDDTNPWLPALGPSFTHGSASVATVLSLSSRLAPDLLQARKIEVQMWKMHTLRQLLSRYATDDGPAVDDPTWENRPAIHDAIFSQIERVKTPSVKGSPQVVVVPLGFKLLEASFGSERSDVLLKAPWLWVMAAGNSGVDAKRSSPPSCFLDMPSEFRRPELILCVGAARMGPNGPEIAEYSNFGSDVDLYTLDSYSGLCPSGTSCAAPVIGTATTLLAARYPGLTPREIRTILIEAAQPSFSGKGWFRYFDPVTMMPAAFKIAEKIK